MPTEYEAKILHVDPGDIARRVIDAGGRVVGSSLQRRYVYDINPDDQSRWMRLRESGTLFDTKTTLTVKHIRHDGIDGTDEVEVEVGDFDRMHQLLKLQGFAPKAYQENRRTSYVLDGAEVEVDEWPMIPAYLEIEGLDREHVIEVAALLGYRIKDLTAENTTKVYARYGIVLSAYPNLRF